MRDKKSYTSNVSSFFLRSVKKTMNFNFRYVCHSSCYKHVCLTSRIIQTFASNVADGFYVIVLDRIVVNYLTIYGKLKI